MDEGLLKSLRDKYMALRALRAGEDGGDPQGGMRSVAVRWPGALRELDELPMDVLDDRIAALEASLAGSPVPTWAPWLAEFHGWMRAALALKRHAGRDHGAARRWIRTDYFPDAGQPTPAELSAALDAVLRPPGGRLSRWILEGVAARHGVPFEECSAGAFPPSPLRVSTPP